MIAHRTRKPDFRCAAGRKSQPKVLSIDVQTIKGRRYGEEVLSQLLLQAR
jgi:hypothetical protein